MHGPYLSTRIPSALRELNVVILGAVKETNESSLKNAKGSILKPTYNVPIYNANDAS